LLDQPRGLVQFVPFELGRIQRTHARLGILADLAHLFVREGQVDFLVLDVAAGRDHPHAVERQAVVRGIVALHVFVEIHALAGHGFGDVLDFFEDLEHLGHLAVFQRGRAVEVQHAHVLDAQLDQHPRQVPVVVDVALLLLALDLVERRLGDVDEAALDQLRHLPVEERQQQRADVRAVHVGVGHDDDLVVARLLDVELVVADARADGGDHRADFLVAEHPVEARLLDVEDLAAQRQDGLELAVAALLGRAAGRIALHQEQLAQRRIALGAVRQLAGQRAGIQRAFAAGQIARLARRLAGPRRQHALLDHLAGDRRVLLEVRRQPLVDDGRHDALDLAVAQLGLRLALELRIGHLDAHHRHEAFADVLAGHRVLFLQQLVGAAVDVDHARQRAAEAAQVRAALDRVDVVRVGQHRLGVAVVVLQRDLDGDPVLFLLEADRIRMQHHLVLVQVLDEFADAAVVAEGLRAHRPVLLFLAEDDLDALVQERQLAQARGQDVPGKLDRAENLVVGIPRHLRAPVGARADDLQRRLRHAALEAHAVDLAFAPDFDLHPLAQRVHAADAHAVEAAGHLVAAVVELAARVEDRQRHFHRRLLQLRVGIHRNAAAVVRDGHRAVGGQFDLDAAAIARQRLVDGVVHHLVHAVVQPALEGVADVHRRPFADRFQPFQNLDFRAIVGFRGTGRDRALQLVVFGICHGVVFSLYQFI